MVTLEDRSEVRPYPTKTANIIGATDRVVSFVMSNAYETEDPRWSPHFMQVRNFTAWIDERGRLSMAMAKLTVKRDLFHYTSPLILTATPLSSTGNGIVITPFPRLVKHIRCRCEQAIEMD